MYTTYNFTSFKNYKEVDGRLHYEMDHKDLGKLFKLIENSVWNKYEVTRKSVEKLPSSEGVYVFTLTDIEIGQTDVAYVGCSTNINRRLYCHESLRFLIAMSATKYKLEIYLWLTEECRDKEHYVIKELDPFLNAEYNKRHYKRFKFEFPKKY